MVPFSCTKENKNYITNSSISAAHPLASQAGKKMYEQNGNAFDAAVLVVVFKLYIETHLVK